jgi:hypothetical protein
MSQECFLPKSSVQTDRLSCVKTFGIVLPNLIIEAILDPDHPSRLLLHTWDGGNAATPQRVGYRGRNYTPAPIAGGLVEAVRFPATSKPFESAAKLTAGMREFLCQYVLLAPEAADLLIAFALASYFVDGLPVGPVLYLLGPEREVSVVLRLLGCLCRRSVLLGDIDTAALCTLPSQLDATLLINQRKLPRCVARILLASNDRHFRIARGSGQLHAYGAKAFSADPEFADGIGVRLSISPARDSLAILTDGDEKEKANDFQAKLLRYRMVNHRRVCDAQIDVRDYVPAMRDEARAWLAPVCDCPDLQKSVSSSLLGQSREAEGDRLSDDRCLVAEAALFFCHRANTEKFFVGEVAACVNALLKGRHEDRVLTDKMVGLLLRALGIPSQRVVKGYCILLTNAVREQIHGIALAYHVPSMRDGAARCRDCPDEKANGRAN